VRRLLRAGWSALLLLALMFLGSVCLWVGVPLGWLWVGGRVQGATGSLGAAFGVALVGVIVSIALLVPVLGRLNGKLLDEREARGVPPQGRTPLESVMIVSASLALVAFAAWFLLFAGAEPVPLGLPK
jgi:hypothetical protein